jgi:hypothetical protein
MDTFYASTFSIALSYTGVFDAIVAVSSCCSIGSLATRRLVRGGRCVVEGQAPDIVGSCLTSCFTTEAPEQEVRTRTFTAIIRVSLQGIARRARIRSFRSAKDNCAQATRFVTMMTNYRLISADSSDAHCIDQFQFASVTGHDTYTMLKIYWKFVEKWADYFA